MIFLLKKKMENIFLGGNEHGERKKSKWKLWDIFMSSGLFTGVAIAFAGYITSSSLERWKTNEAHTQLYAELMGKREEAESALRKDMFTSIITSFLKTEKSDKETPLTEEQELTMIEEKVLNLELLVTNFHESLNLEPLFIHIKKIIMNFISKYDENKSSDLPKIDEQPLIKRLNKIAKEITRKQMLVLEGAGKSFSKQVVFDKFNINRENNEVYPLYPNETLEVNGIERIFRIVVLNIDKTNQEIKVRLEVITESKLDEEDTYIACEFSVGFFDFPMIDNTRLSHDQRCAVVLTDFYKPDSANPIANITLWHSLALMQV